jgi:hypothetical protein
VILYGRKHGLGIELFPALGKCLHRSKTDFEQRNDSMECVSTRWFSRAIVAVLLAIPAAAKADPFGLILDPNPPAEVEGGYKYEYTLLLSADERFTEGDFFTIFDFEGYVPQSIGVANSILSDWDVSVQDFGPGEPTLPGVGNPESNLPNLVFTYKGSEPSAGETIEAGFFATSTHGTVKFGQYSAAHERNVGPSTGPTLWQPAGSQGTLYVPAPEPGSLVLIGMVAPLGLYYVLRRRRAAAAC